MPLSLDTDRDIEQMQIARYRTMTGAEKLARVVDLNRTAEAMAALRLEKQRARPLAAASSRFDIADRLPAANGWTAASPRCLAAVMAMRMPFTSDTLVGRGASAR